MRLLDRQAITISGPAGSTNGRQTTQLGFIKRRVGSREIAEDLAQEVMLRVHRQIGGIERTEAIGAWLHTIARNAITDHYRSASVRRTGS